MAINKVVNKKSLTHESLRNILNYVMQDKKVSEGFVDIYGPYLPDEISAEDVYDAFIFEKRLWEKDRGRMYAHNIISFHPDEPITPEQCLEIGYEFAKQFFSLHQNLICVHQDREHLHVHIITNTVSFLDGKKLHQTKNDLQKQKDFTNQLCSKRGFSVPKKGRHFDGSKIQEGTVSTWKKDTYRMITRKNTDSFLVDCAQAVLEAKKKCCSQEEFIDLMLEKGWHTDWSPKKKRITFENHKSEKVSDITLSQSFSLLISKEALLEAFQKNYERSKNACIRFIELKSDQFDTNTESIFPEPPNVQTIPVQPIALQKMYESQNTSHLVQAEQSLAKEDLEGFEY